MKRVETVLTVALSALLALTLVLPAEGAPSPARTADAPLAATAAGLEQIAGGECRHRAGNRRRR